MPDAATDGPAAVVTLDVSASGRKGGAGDARIEVDLEEMLGLRPATITTNPNGAP